MLLCCPIWMCRSSRRRKPRSPDPARVKCRIASVSGATKHYGPCCRRDCRPRFRIPSQGRSRIICLYFMSPSRRAIHAMHMLTKPVISKQPPKDIRGPVTGVPDRSVAGRSLCHAVRNRRPGLVQVGIEHDHDRHRKPEDKISCRTTCATGSDDRRTASWIETTSPLKT